MKNTIPRVRQVDMLPTNTSICYVRALTIYTFCHIAIKTQNLKSVWKYVTFQPHINIFCAMIFSPMFRTISIYMIYCKKSCITFTTALADTTIMRYDFLPDIFTNQSSFSIYFFFVGITIFLGISTCFCSAFITLPVFFLICSELISMFSIVLLFIFSLFFFISGYEYHLCYTNKLTMIPYKLNGGEAQFLPVLKHRGFLARYP